MALIIACVLLPVCLWCCGHLSGKWSRREELQRRSSRTSRLRSPQRGGPNSVPETSSQNEDLNKTPSTASDAIQLTTSGVGSLPPQHSIDVPDADLSYHPRFATRNPRRSVPALPIPAHLARVKLATSTEPEIAEIEPHSAGGSERSSFSPDHPALSDRLVKQRSHTLQVSPDSSIDQRLQTADIQHTHSSSFSTPSPSHKTPQTCTLFKTSTRQSISSLFY